MGQACNLQRPADPVVLSGQQLPALLSALPNRIVAFRYQNGWAQVPVQIDERRMADYGVVYGLGPTGLVTLAYADPGTYAGADLNALFDADDELVLMAKDAGDRAWPWVGLPAGVETGSGVELALADPLDGGHGFVYLFRSNGSLDPGAGTNYIGYGFHLLAGSYPANYNTSDGPNPEDTVVSNAYYRTHYSDRWVCDHLNLYVGGASGVDILDRHKNLFAPGVCTRTETTFSNGEGAFFANKSGPVRAIRSYLGANSGPLTQRDHFFYEQRQDIQTFLRVHAIPGIMDVYDYSTNATGMSYFNNLNTNGVLIDGVPDSVVPGPTTWEMVTGPQGSLIVIGLLETDIHPFSSTSYYTDSRTPSVTQCTGDAYAYGTSGLWVTQGIPNTDPSLGATNHLVARRIVYYGPPGQTASNAALRYRQATTPLTATNSAFAGDSDDDGLPDAWEQAWFGNLDATGAEDTDEDGQTNWHEYLAGTNPKSASDRMALNFAYASGQLRISFVAQAAAGAGYGGVARYYTMECSAELAAPDWSAVPGFEAIRGLDQPVSLIQSATSIPSRFYRLRAWLGR